MLYAICLHVCMLAALISVGLPLSWVCGLCYNIAGVSWFDHSWSAVFYRFFRFGAPEPPLRSAGAPEPPLRSASFKLRRQKDYSSADSVQRSSSVRDSKLSSSSWQNKTQRMASCSRPSGWYLSASLRAADLLWMVDFTPCLPPVQNTAATGTAHSRLCWYMNISLVFQSS